MATTHKETQLMKFKHAKHESGKNMDTAATDANCLKKDVLNCLCLMVVLITPRLRNAQLHSSFVWANLLCQAMPTWAGAIQLCKAIIEGTGVEYQKPHIKKVGRTCLSG